MINGLPEKISSKILNDFVMGNQEASRDDLLDKCFCCIAPVKRFLRGDKDYLIGVKGAVRQASSVVNNWGQCRL